MNNKELVARPHGLYTSNLTVSCLAISQYIGKFSWIWPSLFESPRKPPRCFSLRFRWQHPRGSSLRPQGSERGDRVPWTASDSWHSKQHKPEDNEDTNKAQCEELRLLGPLPLLFLEVIGASAARSSFTIFTSPVATAKCRGQLP